MKAWVSGMSPGGAESLPPVAGAAVPDVDGPHDDDVVLAVVARVLAPTADAVVEAELDAERFVEPPEAHAPTAASVSTATRVRRITLTRYGGGGSRPARAGFAKRSASSSASTTA